MPRPKKPSAKFKRDPTGSQRKINTYEKALTNLFRNYKLRIVSELQQMNGRYLEAPSQQPFKIEITAAYSYLDLIEEEVITRPAKNIIKVKVPEAYQAGKSFASIQLGATIEERQGEWKKIANLILKNEQAITKVTDDTSNAIRKIIGDGLIKEKTFSEIIRDIVRSIDDIGIVRATVIARTEIMEAVNAGIKDRYKQDGVDKGEWLAALDDSTCEECEELDGKTFPLDDFPDCPAHPQCRCSILPVIDLPGGDWYD